SAGGAQNVVAVDVSDPANPRIAGSYHSTTYLNKTTGLDVDSTGRYVWASSPFLWSQSQPLYPPYALQPGGPTLTRPVTGIDLDRTQIGVPVAPSSEPSNPTAQATASFAFSTTDAVATVRCALDGAPLGLCTSPTTQTYASLAQGSHTFVVQATDAA